MRVYRDGCGQTFNQNNVMATEFERRLNEGGSPVQQAYVNREMTKSENEARA